MTVLEKLRLLTDADNGFGVAKYVMAKYCKCHYASLTRYISGKRKLPNYLVPYIEEGIQHFLDDINAKIGIEE